jgi:hypothetical protein
LGKKILKQSKLNVAGSSPVSRSSQKARKTAFDYVFTIFLKNVLTTNIGNAIIHLSAVNVMGLTDGAAPEQAAAD